ncbi:MAG: hypothetical protein C5B54_08525 [Acidobacteria bacterium]|nr:MAG: hypothetical protein C5B54_08525 [Acidobacteriota bacterium]
MRILAVILCLFSIFAFVSIALSQDTSNPSSPPGNNTMNQGTPNDGEQVSGNNGQITTTLIRRLHDEGINTSGLKVKTNAGKVTLSGKLSNSADLDKIVSIARSIPGVTSVESKINNEENKK